MSNNVLAVRAFRALQFQSTEGTSGSVGAASRAAIHSVRSKCSQAGAQPAGRVGAFSKPAVPLHRSQTCGAVHPTWLPTAVQPGMPSGRPLLRIASHSRQMHWAAWPGRGDRSGRSRLAALPNPASLASSRHIMSLLHRQRRMFTNGEVLAGGGWGQTAARLARKKLQASGCRGCDKQIHLCTCAVDIRNTVASVHSSLLQGLTTAVSACMWNVCLQEILALQPRSGFTERLVRPAVNAVYSAGGHVQRLLPLMVAEVARRDKFASCLAGPSVYDHRCQQGLLQIPPTCCAPQTPTPSWCISYTPSCFPPANF